MVSALAVPAEDSSTEIETYPHVSRVRYVVLQSLIGMMLSYQVVFGAEAAAATMSMLVVAGLVMMVGGLIVVPIFILEASWFSSLLVGIDTILVTATQPSWSSNLMKSNENWRYQRLCGTGIGLWRRRRP